MHLEQLGDSLVQGGRGRWRFSAARKRVSLGFTLPPRANGAKNLMPRSVVLELCFGTPINSANLSMQKVHPSTIWFRTTRGK